jgi:aspartyl-tRNA(Asn)/glutamyl-tRNA(Gln) amidotransferase subunit A
MHSVLHRPISALVAAVQCGEITAEFIARESLKAVHAHENLNAFVHTCEEAVLRTAVDIDRKRQRGKSLGRLAGVPIGIKDAICTLDAPTTCASRILCRDGSNGRRGWQSPYDATVIERLRQQDALIIGKTNMDEFAMGSSTETSAWGPTLNPWDTSRVPGGSSGGSAVAVAARLTPIALGSDTGGSIRQPAGLCGVVGVRPSYGRVSRYGLVAFGSSLEQIGPFANDVRSAAQLLEVIAGPDPKDSTTGIAEVPNFVSSCDRGVSGLRLGIPEEYFGPGLDPEVRERVLEAIDALRQLGCLIENVQLPHTAHGVATYYIVATAEASSNLARFDGVRFGLRVESRDADLQRLYGETRDAGFGREVKRRILLGTYVLSAGYYDAYYKKAQQVRTLIREDFERVFERVNAIVTPICPTPPFKLGQHADDPLAMYLGDIYTLPCNLAGLCGLSVPARPMKERHDRPALPVGLQILGRPYDEATLFAIAAAWERHCGGFPAPNLASVGALRHPT